MINYINSLYENEVKDNQQLKQWVDELADFIAREHYHLTYVDNRQWNDRKSDIVKNICLKQK